MGVPYTLERDGRRGGRRRFPCELPAPGAAMNPDVVFALIPILGILVGGFAIFARSHIGHALAERIAGRAAGSPALETDVGELRAEAEDSRARLPRTKNAPTFPED